MGLRFHSVCSVLTLAATLGVAMGSVHGQAYGPDSIPRQFNDAYFDSTGDYHRATSVRGQLSVILGVGVPWRGFNVFPETQVSEDGQRVHDLYERTMYQQVSGSRIMRTPDLINPFDTSITELPISDTTLPRLGNQAQGILGMGQNFADQAVPFYLPGFAPGQMSNMAPAFAPDQVSNMGPAFPPGQVEIVTPGFTPQAGVPGNIRIVPGAAPGFVPTAQPYVPPTTQVGSDAPPIRALW